MNTNTDLPVGNPEMFLGECEQMDLSELKDKSFMVAINSGARDDVKFICETVHGPYSFLEMVDEVSRMWLDHQHHAKVVILTKNRDEMPSILDECTCDYIEARYSDIITDAFLEGAFDPAEYTCRAGFVTADKSEDPRQQKTEQVDEDAP